MALPGDSETGVSDRNPPSETLNINWSIYKAHLSVIHSNPWMQAEKESLQTRSMSPDRSQLTQDDQRTSLTLAKKALNTRLPLTVWSSYILKSAQIFVRKSVYRSHQVNLLTNRKGKGIQVFLFLFFVAGNGSLVVVNGRKEKWGCLHFECLVLGLIVPSSTIMNMFKKRKSS